jgi:Mg2+-importing ATPase
MINSFWSQTIESLYSQLGSGINGLSDAQVRDKLDLKNKQKKIQSRFVRDFKLLIGQFKSPLVLLLVAAIILSAFLGDTSDVFIILFILLATGGLSFYQERNAGRAVEKLQSMIQLQSNVIRNGKAVTISSSDIVPGDIITLTSGDIVPADCMVILSNESYANEASLTGESYPVRKTVGTCSPDAALSKRDNSLWQGSNIISGTATALVVNIGADTIFGNIAKSITSSTETAFEKGINKFGYFSRTNLILSSPIP